MKSLKWVFAAIARAPRTSDDGQITDCLRLWYMTSSTQCLTIFFLPFELRNTVAQKFLERGYYDVTFNSELRTRCCVKSFY